MHTQLDPNAPQDEQPENDHQGKIKAAETGSIEHGKGEEESAAPGNQRDLVAVPDRSNGADYGAALRIGLRDQEMKYSGPEVEAVEHHIGCDHRGNQPEPDEKHVALLGYGNRPHCLRASDLPFRSAC